MGNVKRPALEGTVAVRDERRLSFAEYGSRTGPAIVWMHGTPGARRQIPLEARTYVEEKGLRIIGIDRPGIGSSTPYLYPNVLDWTADLEILLDTLAIDTARIIGLSGGGPYALAAGAALPDRIHGVGVLGGVAPTHGPDAPEGGIIQLAVRLAPLLVAARVPLGVALTVAIRLVRPLAGPWPRPVRRGAAARRQEPALAAGVQGDVHRRPAQRQPVPDLCSGERPGAVHAPLGLRAR